MVYVVVCIIGCNVFGFVWVFDCFLLLVKDCTV